jgi:hypothetical protein
VIDVGAPGTRAAGFHCDILSQANPRKTPPWADLLATTVAEPRATQRERRLPTLMPSQLCRQFSVPAPM